jgi:hypothetical protein
VADVFGLGAGGDLPPAPSAGPPAMGLRSISGSGAGGGGGGDDGEPPGSDSASGDAITGVDMGTVITPPISETCSRAEIARAWSAPTNNRKPSSAARTKCSNVVASVGGGVAATRPT